MDRDLSRSTLRLQGTTRLFASTLLLLVFTGGIASAGTLKASGTVTVDGTTTKLDHIKVGEFGDAVLVLVTDTELPPPCTVFDPYAVAEKQPLTAVLFPVDSTSLGLSKLGLNAFIHPDVETNDSSGLIRDGLSLEGSDDGYASGSLKTSVTVDDKTYDIAIDLSFPLEVADDPIAPRTVKGADSKPGRQFAKLVEAVMAGDFDTVKNMTASDLHGQMDTVDPKEAGEALASFADFLLPETITITDTKIDGDTAVLTAEGETRACMDTEKSSGRIELVRENGTWKIASVNFQG